MGFLICQGVNAPDADKLSSGYKTEGSSINGIISADLMGKLAEGFIDLVDDPVFFLLELAREDSDGYDIYYLDNCTKEVAHAIMERYGELLIQDGLSRFGFGSNSSEEELYFMDYQEFMIYTHKTKAAEKLLGALGIQKTAKPGSMWEHFSEDAPGSLSSVEVEGETVYDIPDALEEAGMYRYEEE